MHITEVIRRIPIRAFVYVAFLDNSVDISTYEQVQSKNVVPTVIAKVSSLGLLDLAVRGGLAPPSSCSWEVQTNRQSYKYAVIFSRVIFVRVLPPHHTEVGVISQKIVILIKRSL